MAHLQKALDLLFQRVGHVVHVSRVYQSPSMGFTGEDFLNAVAYLQTDRAPASVMQELLSIERDLGRQRVASGSQTQPSAEGTAQSDERHYSSRTIDLDLLAYGDLIQESSDLILPHPRIQNRLFVLQPFMDVAPEWVHPELGLNLNELLAQCPDSDPPKPIAQWLKNPLSAYDFTALRYLAIEGNIGAGKTSLAQMIARDFNGKLILERFADNPFLPQFYQDPERYAFALEMSFLADRFQQLAEQSAQYDLFSDLIITDYDRYKSLIFAKITLSAAEFDLYQKFFQQMHRDLPRPQVYVYLAQSTERLLENIKRRGRSYEQSIDGDYLQKIHSGYLTHLSSEAHQGKVIRIDLNDLDFVQHRSDYLKILDLITKHNA